MCIAVDGAYTVTAQGLRDISELRVGGGSNQQVLEIQSIQSTTARINTTAGGQNTATIKFNNSGGGNNVSQLISPGGQTFVNTGTMTTFPGSTAANPALIDADIVNEATGTIDLRTNASIAQGSPARTWINRGTLTIASGTTLSSGLTTGTTSVFRQEGGTLTNNGALRLIAYEVTFSGGSILSNPIEHFRGKLMISTANAGKFELMDGVELTGDVSAAQSISLIAGNTINGSGLSMTFSTPGAFTNAGTIALVNRVSSGNITMRTGTAGQHTFTNTGTFRIDPFAGSGGRDIQTAIVNAGLIDIDKSAALATGGAATSSILNDGTVDIASGQTLIVTGAGRTLTQHAGSLVVGGLLNVNSGVSFVYSGGTISGNPLDLQGTPTLNATLDVQNNGPLTVNMRQNNMLRGHLYAGQTVNVFGTTTQPAVIDIPVSLTSEGTIRLADEGNNAASITTPTGATFTNAGSLLAVPGASIQRFMSANITNTGLIDLTANTSITTPRNWINQGTVSLASNRTLAFSGGATLRNDGAVTGGGTVTMSSGTVSGSGTMTANVAVSGNSSSVSPGGTGATGQLAVTGTLSHSAQSTMNIELGGSAPGTGFDQISATGAVSLAGALNVTRINGFTPLPCQEFPIITGASRSGTFGTLNLPAAANGISMRAVYTSTALVIVAYPTTGTVGVAPTSLEVTEGGPAATYKACFSGPPAPTSPRTVTATPQAGITVSPTSVTFTSTTGDWELPKAFSVTAVDDEAAELQQTLTIANTSTGLTLPNVNVVVNDNDRAPRLGAGQIAFASNRSGNYDIWVANEDGSNPVNITPNSPANCQDPAFSPDATRVAFACDSASNSVELWVMDSKGTSQQLLNTANSSGSDADPAWSPDGRKLVFASNRSGNFRLYVYDFDNASAPPVEITSAGSAGFPSWSPDGQTIAFRSLGDIYTVPAGGGSVTPLTSGGGSDDTPRFSPDGQQIAFTNDSVDGQPDVYVMNANGTNRRLVHATASVPDSQPDWSPKGDRLVFHVGAPATLATVKIDGTGFAQLFAPEGDSGGASWIANVTIVANSATVGASPSSVPTSVIPQQSLAPTVQTAGLPQLPLIRSPILQLPLIRSPILQLPLIRSPILQLPLIRSPLLQLPLIRSPLGMRALLPNDLGNQPAVQAGLRRILLSQVPVKSGPGWKQRLAGSALEHRPLQDITLADVLAAGLPDDTVPSLEQLDLSRGTFGRLTTFATMMGETRLSAYAGINWCSALATQGFSCASVGGLNSTLVALEFAGVNLDEIPGLSAIRMQNVALPGADFAALSAVALDSFDLPSASVGGIKLQTIPNVGQVANCGSGAPGSHTIDCTGTATINDASVAGALKDTATIGALGNSIKDLTLQEVVLGTYDGDAEDSYDARASDLGIMGYDAAGAGANAFTYTARFAPVVRSANGVKVTVDLPADFRYVAGSRVATMGGGSVSVGEPAVDEEHLVFTAPFNVPAGQILAIQFSAHPGLELGTHAASVRVEGLSGDGLDQMITDEGAIDVGPNGENGDSIGTATSVNADTLTYRHMDHAGDVDYFKVDVPIPGSRVTVSINQCECDADVVLYHPASARTSVPLRTALPDAPIKALTDQIVGLARLGEPLIPEPDDDISLADLPIAAASANRGNEQEVVQAVSFDAVDPTYTIQVASYNGSTSEKAYGMRVTVTPPLGASPAGDARAFPHEDDASLTNPGLPSVPTDVKTLILADSNRMRRAYGDEEAEDAMDALDDLAASAVVKGVVVDVSALADVEAAQANADELPSNPERANDVVRAINAGVDTLLGSRRSQLQHLVIAGSDEILPMARIPDLTQGANERDFAQELAPIASTTGGNNALHGAAATGMVLTDDPYGAFAPRPWLGTFLYVPDVAIGRLVETPADIVAAVDTFLHPANQGDADGTLRPATNVTTGYDFMTKMAQAIKTSLDAQLGTPQPPGLISESWTKTDFDSAITNAAPMPDILAPNAHMNATTLQPAAGASLVSADSLRATNAVRKILFTMGCHSGFSITDYLGATGGSDWPQAVARLAAAFVGNTGYGVGVRDTIAFSSRLFADFADNIGQMTLGQALMTAKQQYVAAGPPNVYDYKVMAQATYFGLPGFRVASTVAPPPPPAPRTLGIDTITGLQIASVNVANPIGSGDAWELVDNGEGFYYRLGDGAIDPALRVAPNRPIQPRIDIDVTQSGKQAAGALIVGASSVDEAFDPALARPLLSDQDNEPELQFSDVIFPTAIQDVTSWRALDGPRQNLVLVPAQFRSTNNSGETAGIERRFTDLRTLVYYRPAGNTDHDPLVYRSITATAGGGLVRFATTISDEDGDTAARVLALYHVPDQADWLRADLVPGPDGTWSVDAPVNGTEVEYILQAVKSNGEVFVTTNKGSLFDSVAEPPPPPGAITMAVGGTPIDGWYSNPASVTIAGPGPFDVEVDGVFAGTFTAGAPITVTGDGRHLVTYDAPDGRTGGLGVAVDGSGPSITPIFSPSAINDWYPDPVTVHFDCVDTGSGVDECPADVVLHDGANQSVTVTAVDTFGNVGSLTVNDIDVDGTGPTSVIDRAIGQADPTNSSSVDFRVVFNEPVTGFDAGDVALSGTAAEGATKTVTAASASTYTVTVSNITKTGNITVMSPAPDALDLRGNRAVAATAIDNTVLVRANTTTVLTTSDDTAVGPQSITFTATVDAVDPFFGPGPGWRGTVTFRDVTGGGNTVLASRDMENGVSRYSMSAGALPLGNRTITATYNGYGDGIYGGFNGSASAPLSQSVAPAPTTTELSSNPTSVAGRQSVTFTATVSSSGYAPVGSVEFRRDTGSGTALLATKKLTTSGVATYATATLPIGDNQRVVAEYVPSSSRFIASSDDLRLDVVKAATSVTLTTTDSTAVGRQSVTFTATVASDLVAAGVPTGTVTFYRDGVSLGAKTLSSTGSASLATSTLPVGTSPITATYSGADRYLGSSSAVLNQSVAQAATAVTAFTTSDATAVGKQAVTFTATIASNDAAAGVPTGTVTFYRGGTSLGSKTLSTTGVAVYSSSTLPIGTLSITAVYNGSDRYLAASSGPLGQSVSKADTTLALTSSGTPSTAGSPVTFTATVTPADSAAGVPDGSVTFKEGATTLKAVTLSNGQAAYTTSSLVVGGHSITAEYVPGARFNGSTKTITHQVNA